LSNRQVSRRKFLKALGGIAATTAAGGVLWQVLPKEKLNPAKPRTNAFTENGKALLSIVKGQPNTDIDNMVRRSVDAIGGMASIVSAGKTVVVKPAVVTFNPNCAPDPRVVEAVVNLAKDAGGTVIVAESSGGGDTQGEFTAYCLSQVGITAAAERAGAEVRVLPREELLLMEVPKGTTLRSVKTFPTIYNCDVLISVPRLKRHTDSTVTVSLKNMMGIVPASEKRRFHDTDLSQCIADLNTAIGPDLTVVDATFAMTRTGPIDGDMVAMDTVMASGDPVAADRVAAQRLFELEQRLEIAPFDPAGVRHINAAGALGVGTLDPSRITILEESLS